MIFDQISIVKLVVSVLVHYFTWPPQWQESNDILRELTKNRKISGALAWYIRWDAVIRWVAFALAATGYFFLWNEAHFVGNATTNYNAMMVMRLVSLLLYGCSVFHFVYFMRYRNYRLLALALVILAVIGSEAAHFILLVGFVDWSLLATETQVMALMGTIAYWGYLLVTLIVMICLNMARSTKYIEFYATEGDKIAVARVAVISWYLQRDVSGARYFPKK